VPQFSANIISEGKILQRRFTMNYTVLILATLMVCFSPSALGINCNKCTPDDSTSPPKTCNTAAQLTEVNCDNENGTIPGTNITIEYDTCITAKIVATLSGIQIPTYAMECAAKDNSSDPSMINCTSAEAYICALARDRVKNQPSIQIISCNAKCCNSARCNNMALIDTAEPTGSTTAATTPKSSVTKVQPPLLGFLLILLAIAFL